MTLILFEDERTDQLAPAALARPALAISCGGYRLAELLADLQRPMRCAVRPHLQEIADRTLGEIACERKTVEQSPPTDGIYILVNTRLVPAVSSLVQLQTWIAESKPGIVYHGDAVAAALVVGDPPPESHDPEKIRRYLDRLSLDRLDIRLPLLEYPHDIVKYHLEIFADNLRYRIEQGEYHEADDAVFLAPGARLDAYVTTDTSAGPIVLDARAHVGPHSSLRGPCYLGHDAQVVDGSMIASHVSAGQKTKLGGEISCSIIESYTSKSHHGFLGHSYLGSWVNLGAGTTNSNLKNTYGEINMQYGETRVLTDMQFMGCVIGDYTKTAINTAIFTGKTVGACSMLYGFVTENVPSFVNYARQFGKITEVSVDAATTVQSRVFKRRGVTIEPSDATLLESLHALTTGERERFDGEMLEGPLVF